MVMAMRHQHLLYLQLSITFIHRVQYQGSSPGLPEARSEGLTHVTSRRGII